MKPDNAFYHKAPEPLLRNYKLLVERVDDWLAKLERELKIHMQCKPGCSGCCRNFTVYPVEAFAISSYLKIDAASHMDDVSGMNNVDSRDDNKIGGDYCVFLDQDMCTIYPVRPLICRTHGYPVAVKTEMDAVSKDTQKLSCDADTRKEIRIDHCPENFQNITLNREHLIDLEHLNTILFSINSIFVKEFYAGKPNDLVKTSWANREKAAYERISFQEILRKTGHYSHYPESH
ncbi:MAG: YkgJ family cysteine cluster protein [Desulfamplus sp.]|nr:YkgJ family cysteine cluster protein [Desulfamplus sp.]